MLFIMEVSESEVLAYLELLITNYIENPASRDILRIFKHASAVAKLIASGFLVSATTMWSMRFFSMIDIL